MPVWYVIFIILLACTPASLQGIQWKPTQGMRWQVQFVGNFKEIPETEIYDVDLFDISQEEIKSLKENGKKVVCYFSAGTSEKWRKDFILFKPQAIGNKLKNWANENWLDIRSTNVKNIMKERIALAQDKGCNAIDPDNIDGYTQNTGFSLTAKDQLIFNKFLSKEAHLHNLSIGLKNDLGQIPDLVQDFDFAINESCINFNECHLLKPFIEKNKPVLVISYHAKSKKDCELAKEQKFDLIIKNQLLDEKRELCPTSKIN